MSENLNILIHNKNEFISKLNKILIPQIIIGFQSIYDNTRKKNKIHRYLLKEFQTELSQTPNWSKTIIEGEFDRIKNSSSCDWLDNLIKNIFLINAEILSITTQKEQKNQKLTINMPTPPMFVHKCYINIARIIWKMPQLFYHKLNKIDIINNKKRIEDIIDNSIRDTILQLMPLEDFIIYKDNNDDVDNDESINDEEYNSHSDDEYNNEEKSNYEDSDNESESNSDNNEVISDVDVEKIDSTINAPFPIKNITNQINNIEKFKEQNKNIIGDEVSKEHNEKNLDSINKQSSPVIDKNLLDDIKLTKNTFSSDKLYKPLLSPINEINKNNNQISSTIVDNKAPFIDPISNKNDFKTEDNTKEVNIDDLEEDSENEQLILENLSDSEEKTMSTTIDNHQESYDNNQESVENNQESVENNQESVENNQESIENNKEFVENNQEFVENNQELVENNQELVENNQESVENNQEFVENNQELVENNQELVENNQESVENNQESVENNQELQDDNIEEFTETFPIESKKFYNLELEIPPIEEKEHIKTESPKLSLEKHTNFENFNNEINDNDNNPLFTEEDNDENQKIIEINENKFLQPKKKEKKYTSEEKLKRNNEKIQNLLGLDIDYKTFVKNKERIKKILLSKSIEGY